MCVHTWFVTQRVLASPLSSQSPCRVTNMVLQLQEALSAIILLSCCAERRAIRRVCRDTLRIGNDMAIYFSTFLTCNWPQFYIRMSLWSPFHGHRTMFRAGTVCEQHYNSMAEEAVIGCFGQVMSWHGHPSHAVTVHGCSSIDIQIIHSIFVRDLRVSEWVAYYGNPAALSEHLTDV